jgi:putative FmdB family regulatory protein
MPIYDYCCSDCKTTFDVFHKGREMEEDILCPSCGSGHYKKLMSVPVVSMTPVSKGRDYSSGSSCETSGCCGGSCGLN